MSLGFRFRYVLEWMDGYMEEYSDKMRVVIYKFFSGPL